MPGLCGESQRGAHGWRGVDEAATGREDGIGALLRHSTWPWTCGRGSGRLRTCQSKVRRLADDDRTAASIACVPRLDLRESLKQGTTNFTLAFKGLCNYHGLDAQCFHGCLLSECLSPHDVIAAGRCSFERSRSSPCSPPHQVDKISTEEVQSLKRRRRKYDSVYSCYIRVVLRRIRSMNGKCDRLSHPHSYTRHQ